MNKETVFVVAGSHSEYRHFMDKIAIKAENVIYTYVPGGCANIMRGHISGTKVICFGDWYERSDVKDIGDVSEISSFTPIYVSER